MQNARSVSTELKWVAVFGLGVATGLVARTVDKRKPLYDDAN